MKIVPQSAKFSCSLVPVALLAAPRIAGLLPAWAGREPEQPPKNPPTIAFISQPRPRVYRSFAEWQAADGELATWFEGACQRLTAVRAEVEDEIQSRLATLYQRRVVAYHD